MQSSAQRLGAEEPVLAARLEDRLFRIKSAPAFAGQDLEKLREARAEAVRAVGELLQGDVGDPVAIKVTDGDVVQIIARSAKAGCNTSLRPRPTGIPVKHLDVLEEREAADRVLAEW